MTTNLAEMAKIYPINDLKETLLDLYQQKLIEYGIKGVKVSRAYPRKAIPGGAIIVVQRSEVAWTPVGLGQLIASEDDINEAGEAVTTRAVGLNEKIEVSIWSSTEDMRDLLFVFAQGAVLEEYAALQGYGFTGLSMVGATDDEIDDQMVANTYWYRNVLHFAAYDELRTKSMASVAASINQIVNITPPIAFASKETP